MFYWRRYILLILSSTLAKIPVLPYLLCVEHSIYYVTSYAYVCSIVVCNKLFTHVTIIIFIVSTALVTNTSVRHVLLFYF